VRRVRRRYGFGWVAATAFNDVIGPLLASPSERVELQLLHQFVK
jgi:hypothetical protein